MYLIWIALIFSVTTPAFGQNNDSNATEFPYLASLGPCSATIISDRWLVTAAHCLRKSNNVTMQRSSSETKVLNYSKIVKHPQFKWLAGIAPINDIALIRLAEPLTLNDDVKPVELPKGRMSSNVPAVFVHKTDHNTLMKRNVTQMFGERCLGYFDPSQRGFIRPQLRLFETVSICTKEVAVPPGPCAENTAGPMVQNDTLYGISSYIHQYGNYGPNCYRLYFFTNIANYVRWIQSVIV
ncbi:serine protease 1-like [Pectinophora gossypiella]|uniref:serine protease 1-like n=1 Tax=Pectinophora gossypiella TaxID=13191 RepID=UPI00214ED1C3|nr:serine protease 1-like [Pectinophora gossypiella]